MEKVKNAIVDTQNLACQILKRNTETIRFEDPWG